MEEWKIPDDRNKDQETLPKDLLDFIKEIHKAKEKYKRKLERKLEGSTDLAPLRQTAPKVEVRREGFWAKPKKTDLEYEEAILLARRDPEFLAYVQTLLARFNHGSKKMITSLILEMEEDDEELPEGSLSQIVGHALTFYTAKSLSQFQIDASNLYAQAALERRSRWLA